jgi:hypothetical protein
MKRTRVSPEGRVIIRLFDLEDGETGKIRLEM